MNVQDQDIVGTNLGQLIHDNSNSLLFHHGADSHPAVGVKGLHRGGTLARCDLGGVGELGSLDVVLAEDEALGGNDTADTGGDELDELCVGGVLGLDEDGGGVDDGVDGLETSSAHGFTGF